ncbi:multi-sensor hybrid histidine kinase [Desulfonatronospira thiodismutans ASO3-1]|uniref:histidine kinase n=1 Tax=Desulfonatronospira thiodismutans ASO3-1 TaxID=555779 RepID=D6SS37_9BACT|nr:response regulator [Desulfonatronospira thiodismutans]EFI33503.1 multi-sensor hybrid histidine kinase [Desulfonatronospira thiodismutans ASO3-1]
MSAIYILSRNQGLQKLVEEICQAYFPESSVRVLEPGELEDLMVHSEINVCILDEQVVRDYQDGPSLALRKKFHESGFSILMLYQDEEPAKLAGEVQADSVLNVTCSRGEFKSRLEHLFLISELRAMNLNLRAQLDWRVNRMDTLEQELWHTNTILKALSRCNEIIIKADDEQTMLQNVCQTISSQIGYPLVWVDYARRDSEQSVKIMASSGPKKDLVKVIKINWNESPYGQGPTSRAIKTGQPVHIEDVSKDPCMHCWSELFMKEGIREILSLPIAYSGVGFGALTITSQSSGSFAGKTREYLESVARNMGYGVWFLRHRAKRKQVEKELQKTNEIFTLAMEATQDAIWDWDIRSGTTYFSPRWYTMLGYEPYELPQNYDSFLAVIHPADKDEVKKQMDGFLRQSENFSIEYRAVSKNGETLWILTRGKVVQSDEQGRPLRMAGTNVDMTERKLMEQELSQAKKSAETANRAKDRFLENMNHELRTPLNGIMSVLQTLADSELKPAEKEYVEMALNSSSQLLASLNKILELSSLQDDIQQVHPQPFVLHEEMSKLVSFFQPQARNKQIGLELDIQEDVPSWLVSDVGMLRQIVWNLVDNAVKFTHEGKVVLRISKQSDSRQDSEATTVPLLFEVEDTGGGIPHEMQKDIFEPFVIGEHDIQFKRYQGTGIGLSVCRQLVRSLGGETGVESRKGLGSTFYFILELEPGRETEEDLPEYEEILNPENKCILIVEDEKINLMLIRRMLQKKGFNVLTAMDGREALEVLKSNQDISLILMDVMVPVHDGYELTRMIRKGDFDGLKQVPIVAVTALADAASRQHCFEAGMNAYLSKPVDNSELMKMIRRYLARSQ